MLLSSLEPITLADRIVRLEPLAEFHRAGLREAAVDPALWAHMFIDASTAGGFAGWFAEAMKVQGDGSALVFAVCRPEDGLPLGSTRYMNISRRDGRLEIGSTWYAAAAQGGAINPACKRLLLAHAFEALGAERVEFKTDARNARSRAAIAKLGAVEEGTLRRHMLVQHGHLRDTVYFSVLKDEWPAVRARLDARLAAM
ncbi:MAG: GNAT family N-acetyltransferase [Inquilinus sp.]|nr:GNAT family N-acetyltransferase [Inquilinus sp.]